MRKVGGLPKSVEEKKKIEKKRESASRKRVKNMRRISKPRERERESNVVGYEAEEGTGRRKETKLAFELCLRVLSNPSGSNTIMRRLTTGILSEK